VTQIKLLHVSAQRGVTFWDFCTKDTQQRPVPHGPVLQRPVQQRPVPHRPKSQSAYPFWSHIPRHTIQIATTLYLGRITVTAILNTSILCLLQF